MRDVSVVMFADISGSTALLESVGNDRGVQAITLVVQWLAHSIKSHGGRVIKTLGDGVLSIFPDAARAARASTALMRSHERNIEHWPSEVALRVRVGVAGGEVIELEGDCYGEAVHMAARLCSRAAAGEVWFTESTVQNGGLSPMAHWTPMGSLLLHGHSAPVSVYGLEWCSDEDPDSRTLRAELHSGMGKLSSSLVHIQVQWCGTNCTYTSRDMPLIIGRGTEARLRVDDRRVSRSHARLEWRQDAFVLSDVSRFGTWVHLGDSDPILLRRESCLLVGSGSIALGVSFLDATAPKLEFQVSDAGVFVE